MDINNSVVGIAQPPQQQQNIEQNFIEKVKEQSKTVTPISNVENLNINPNLYKNISTEIETIQEANKSIATEHIKIEKLDKLLNNGNSVNSENIDDIKEVEKLKSELSYENFSDNIEKFREESKITIDNSYKKIQEALNDISSKRGIDFNNQNNQTDIDNSIKDIIYKYRVELENGNSEKLFHSSILQQQLGVLLS